MIEQKKTYEDLERELEETRTRNVNLANRLMDVQTKCIDDMHNYIRALIWDCNTLRKQLREYNQTCTPGFDTWYSKKENEESTIRDIQAALAPQVENKKESLKLEDMV